MKIKTCRHIQCYLALLFWQHFSFIQSVSHSSSRAERTNEEGRKKERGRVICAPNALASDQWYVCVLCISYLFLFPGCVNSLWKIKSDEICLSFDDQKKKEFSPNDLGSMPNVTFFHRGERRNGCRALSNEMMCLCACSSDLFLSSSSFILTQAILGTDLYGCASVLLFLLRLLLIYHLLSTQEMCEKKKIHWKKEKEWETEEEKEARRKGEREREKAMHAEYTDRRERILE